MNELTSEQGAKLANLRASSANQTEVATRPPRVIAVASGKGGVGKTSICANLAVAFAEAGERVLILDGDLGLSNIDLAFGVTPEYSLADVLEGRRTVRQALTEAAHGIKILAAGSGRFDLANLSDRDRHNLFAAIDSCEDDFDVLLVDIGAGIGANAVSFAGAAQNVVIVTNDEPTALADAYAFIKVLATRCGTKRVQLIANAVRNAAHGEEVYRRLALLLDRFLGIGIDYLGHVGRDSAMNRASREGLPVLLGEPRSAAALCLRSVARRLSDLESEGPQSGGVHLFWKRLLNWRAAS